MGNIIHAWAAKSRKGFEVDQVLDRTPAEGSNKIYTIGGKAE
jgi:hypothetical protein